MIRSNEFRVTPGFAAARVFLSVLVLGLGSIAFLPGAYGQEREITVSGVVREASSGAPIVAVSVIYRDVVVAMTDGDGVFSTVGLATSNSTLNIVFRRIGYHATERDIELSDSESVFTLDVMLMPAATEVERIVVPGERVAVANPGLVEFYERREQGYGSYLTAEEIARIGGNDLQNHLRRLRLHYGLRRSMNLLDGGTPTFPDTCFVAFVDGVRLADLTAINDWVPPSSLGGIELYRPEDLAHLPGKYVQPPAGGCGRNYRVILFWSKVLPEPSSFEFGIHVGSRVSGSDGRAQYVGGKFVTPVRRGRNTHRLHIDMAFRVNGSGDKTVGMMNISLRPFGQRSPLYAGSGLGFTRRSDAVTARRGESLSGHHTIIIGVSGAMSMLSPFAEAQILDPLYPNSVSASMSFGLSVRYRGR